MRTVLRPREDGSMSVFASVGLVEWSPAPVFSPARARRSPCSGDASGEGSGSGEEMAVGATYDW